jgi:hypothetical protein
MTQPEFVPLHKRIEAALNEHSRENESNTPDYILAKYLLDCLRAFEMATKARESWYGVELAPGRRWAEEDGDGR